MNNCAICNEPSTVIRGGVRLCALHHAEVDAEIAKLREAGRPVNIGRIVLALRDGDTREYYLRGIPVDDLKQLKKIAAEREMTVKDLLLEAIQKFIAEEKAGG